jgi:hypothetical protein
MVGEGSSMDFSLGKFAYIEHQDDSYNLQPILSVDLQDTHAFHPPALTDAKAKLQYEGFPCGHPP